MCECVRVCFKLDKSMNHNIISVTLCLVWTEGVESWPTSKCPLMLIIWVTCLWLKTTRGRGSISAEKKSNLEISRNIENQTKTSKRFFALTEHNKYSLMPLFTTTKNNTKKFNTLTEIIEINREVSIWGDKFGHFILCFLSLSVVMYEIKKKKKLNTAKQATSYAWHKEAYLDTWHSWIIHSLWCICIFLATWSWN